jgi:hypothetical protein
MKEVSLKKKIGMKNSEIGLVILGIAIAVADNLDRELARIPD